MEIFFLLVALGLFDVFSLSDKGSGKSGPLDSADIPDSEGENGEAPPTIVPIDKIIDPDSAPEPEPGVSLQGGLGNDVLRGTLHADTLSGGAGNDVLLSEMEGYGDASDDLLIGGDGNDRLVGDLQARPPVAGYLPATGQDTLLGGDGNDTLDGGVYQDGGAGDDRLTGAFVPFESGEYATLIGGEGDDFIQPQMQDGIVDAFHPGGPVGARAIIDGGSGSDTIQLTLIEGMEEQYIVRGFDPEEDALRIFTDFDWIDTAPELISDRDSAHLMIDGTSQIGFEDPAAPIQIDDIEIYYQYEGFGLGPHGNAHYGVLFTEGSERLSLGSNTEDVIALGALDMPPGQGETYMVMGFGGDDEITTSSNAVTYVSAGDGDDTILVLNSSSIEGGAGDDFIDLRGVEDKTLVLDYTQGDGAILRANGGDGDDTLLGSRGTLRGGAGNDSLVGGGPMSGGDGDDTLVGGSYVSGGDGADTFFLDERVSGVTLGAFRFTPDEDADTVIIDDLSQIGRDIDGDIKPVRLSSFEAGLDVITIELDAGAVEPEVTISVEPTSNTDKPEISIVKFDGVPRLDTYDQISLDDIVFLVQ